MFIKTKLKKASEKPIEIFVALFIIFGSSNGFTEIIYRSNIG